MKRKQQSLCWGGNRKKFKCEGDGGGGDDDDDDDHDHDHDHDRGGDDDDAGGDDDDDGGGGNERASNLFLRANQPSSEAFSHQNPTRPQPLSETNLKDSQGFKH